MGETALKKGADTFQFFTRNPRGRKAKEIDPEDAKKLLELMEENRFPCILAHAPYTLNPCSANEDTRPVSYTHLDVYKRQLLRSSAIVSSANCLVSSFAEHGFKV